jgi:integrase/recombinase XerD
MLDENHIKTFGIYLANRKNSKATIQNYQVTLKKFLTFIDKSPKDITIDDIEKYVNCMLTDGNTYKQQTGKAYHPNSLCSKFSAMKVYISFLNDKFHRKNPIQYDNKKDKFLQPPPHMIPEKTVLTQDEVQSIFDCAKGNKRDLAMLNTIYYSTQRKTTIQMLNISDIDFSTQRMEYKHGLKRKMGDKKPHSNYPKDAIPSLIDYIQHGRETPLPGHEDALFLNGFGKRICSETLNTVVKKYTAKAGIKKRVYVHLFRATAVTIMDSKGMTRDQIKMITGHSDTKTLDTYLRPDATECNNKCQEALSLKKPTQEGEVKPSPRPPEKPKPPPQDSYIAKTDNPSLEEMKLRLQLIQAELELERLKQQNHNSSLDSIYG